MIRDARPDERERIGELTFGAYGQYAEVMAPTTWGALQTALHGALSSADAMERIVAELDGVVVGSVMLFRAGIEVYGDAIGPTTWPEMRILSVDPAARGKGVGAALVGECARRARAAGASELGLHTSTSMPSAIRMYERLGFVRAPDHDFTPDGAELVMGYRLVL